MKKEEHLHIMISSEDKKKLEQYANKIDISVSQVVRHLIKELVNK